MDDDPWAASPHGVPDPRTGGPAAAATPGTTAGVTPGVAPGMAPGMTPGGARTSWNREKNPGEMKIEEILNWEGATEVECNYPEDGATMDAGIYGADGRPH